MLKVAHISLPHRRSTNFIISQCFVNVCYLVEYFGIRSAQWGQTVTLKHIAWCWAVVMQTRQVSDPISACAKNRRGKNAGSKRLNSLISAWIKINEQIWKTTTDRGACRQAQQIQWQWKRLHLSVWKLLGNDLQWDVITQTFDDKLPSSQYDTGTKRWLAYWLAPSCQF